MNKYKTYYGYIIEVSSTSTGYRVKYDNGTVELIKPKYQSTACLLSNLANITARIKKLKIKEGKQ